MDDKLHQITYKSLLKGLIYIILHIILVGCGTTKYIPIETTQKEVVTYRDSTIIHQDTIYTKIPVEFYYDYSPILDTLHLETSLAKASAYLDTTAMMIKGGIENKETTLPVEYIWKERVVESVDTVIVEKQIPYEVEVVKYKRDRLFWGLLSYAVLSLLALGAIIYTKLRVL